MKACSNCQPIVLEKFQNLTHISIFSATSLDEKSTLILKITLSVVISLWQLFSLEIIAGKTEGWQTKYVCVVGWMRGQRWGQGKVAGSCRIERVINVKYCAAAQLCVCVCVGSTEEVIQTNH